MNTILTTEVQDNSGNLFLQTLDSISWVSAGNLYFDAQQNESLLSVVES